MAPAAKKAAGVKRTQDAKVPKGCKKPKVDPLLLPTVEAIESCSDLPLSCKEMLKAILPGSLAVLAEQREAPQARVVEMLREIVGERQVALERGVSAEEERSAALERRREELVGATSEAEGRAATAAEAAAAAKTAASEAQEAAAAAKVGLAAAREAQVTGDKEYAQAESSLEEVKAAAQEHLPSLRGEDWNAEGAANRKEALLAVLRKLPKADDSLLVSVPGILAKVPDVRSDFDTMVLTEMEKSLGSRIADLEATLAVGEDAKAARVAAVVAAEQAAGAAEAKRHDATARSLDLEAESSDAASAAQTASKEVAAFGPELKSAAKLLDGAQATLKLFCDHNVASFEALSSKA